MNDTAHKLTAPFSQRIRWERPGAPTRSGAYGFGRLAGRCFEVRIYANGNPSSSGWSVSVQVGRDHKLTGTYQRSSGMVGGIGAARRRMRDLIREAVAIDRGDPFPGRKE